MWDIVWWDGIWSRMVGSKWRLSSVIEWSLVDNLVPLKNKENSAEFSIEN